MTPIIVQPSRGWPKHELRQVWAYRDLLFYLAWRDVSVRYKQTLIGAAWAVVQPVCSMLVFSLFFGSLAGLPSDGVPYGIFCFAALLPWNYFAKAMSQAGASLVSDRTSPGAHSDGRCSATSRHNATSARSCRSNDVRRSCC